MNSSMVRKPGFSLVELVIVVIILGIIAAIAIPRMSRASKGAAEAALRKTLGTFRAAIDLYAAEHGGDFPGADGMRPTFRGQLEQRTDSQGNIGSVPGVHIYGPYLMNRPPLPVGPNAGATGILMRTDNPLSNAIDESRTAKGWIIGYETGDVIPNTDDLDDSGVPYHTY